jgi:hypothetical protein
MISKAVFVHIGAAFIIRSQMVLLFNETRYLVLFALLMTLEFITVGAMLLLM